MINSFVLTGGALLLSACASQSKTTSAVNEYDTLMVDPNEAIAKSMRYNPNASKGNDSNQNTCATCQHYTEKTEVNGKKIGTCNIFQGKYVNSGAVCVAWAKR
jgi:hypothetical protein